jgi:hypothetical protein
METIIQKKIWNPQMGYATGFVFLASYHRYDKHWLTFVKHMSKIWSNLVDSNGSVDLRVGGNQKNNLE